MFAPGKPVPYVIVVSAQSHLNPSCTVQCSPLSLGTSGSGGWYPEIGDHPKQVVSNPLQKVLSNPVLGPEKVLIEPQ